MISSSPIWRLTSKSVGGFGFVSKLWESSRFGSPYFKRLFMTKSLAKPRLLFAIEEGGAWSFFSSPQLENPHEKSLSTTLVADAEFYVRFSPEDLLIDYYSDPRYFSCGYASGLLYMYGDRYQARPLICNPITGRYAILPSRYTYEKAYSFFGFEPIDKQYKALSMVYPCGPGHNKILTFGDGDMSWRNVKCSLRHDIESDGVCINGVLYYIGNTSECFNKAHVVTSCYPIVCCFDIRSEKFTFIDLQSDLQRFRFSDQLINYKGKLAVISSEWKEDLIVDATNELYVRFLELYVWVLEDVEKQEWSKYAYTLRDDKFFPYREVSISGVTDSGEIVFSMREYTPEEPFYVFYINPERNFLQRVEIQGFGEAVKEWCTVLTFVNHVENHNANDLKLLKSVHPPLEKREYVEPSDSESD